MLLDAALKETKLKCLSLCQQPVCLEEFSTMVFCLWRRLCFHLFFTEIHCKHQTFLSVDLECVSMVYQDSTFTWGLSVILAESLEGICVRKNFFNITELCWIWMIQASQDKMKALYHECMSLIKNKNQIGIFWWMHEKKFVRINYDRKH